MNDRQYDFCPKCGALARDGVCPSCNYRGAKEKHENESHESVSYQEKPHSDVPEKTEYNWEKKKNPITPIITIVGVCLIVVLCFYVIYDSIHDSQEFMSSKRDKEYLEDENDIYDFFEKEFGEKDDFINDDIENENSIPEDDKSYMDDMNPFDESWKEKYKNHTKEQLEGEFYEDIVDCIDTEVDYQIKREFDEYYDNEYGVAMQVSYIQLAGKIPNLEMINERLKDKPLYYIENYEEIEDTYRDVVEEYNLTLSVQSDSYVTYNDNEKISILIDERVSYTYGGVLQVHSINIDLTTGEVMDNTEILNIDETFIADFKKKSRVQNGNSSGLEMFTNEQLLAIMNKEENLILFYTPLGIEVGYNYNAESLYGWLTITVKEYEEYLK